MASVLVRFRDNFCSVGALSNRGIFVFLLLVFGVLCGFSAELFEFFFD